MSAVAKAACDPSPGEVEIIAGNAYLAAYARQWNEVITVVPTVVYTSVDRLTSAVSEGPVTIGWIGSPSTWTVYVRPYLVVLRQFCAETEARFLAIGAGAKAEQGRFPGMVLHNRSELREIADIQEMDIGFVPLSDDAWARGKCGYKLIQYIACGLPTVASPVGVNCEIVKKDWGFLAGSDLQWGKARSLIADPGLRKRMGVAGPKRVEADYSLEVHAPRLVEIMERAIATRKA